MHRVVLISSLVLSGCFFAPTVEDCAVACSSSCPAGLQCIDGLCRASASVSCECQNGLERACGVTQGACKAGVQTCAAGAWSGCVGELAPTAEVCDGVDNDCDGLIDQGPEVVLVDHGVDAWRFFSLDAGYGLVTVEQVAGETVATVRRLGPDLALQQATLVPLPWGNTGRMGDAVGRGDSVYLAWDVDAGVELIAVEGGQVKTFQGVGDAGVRAILRAAVGDDQLVAHWDRPGLPSTFLARWSLDGQLKDVTELSSLDAGVLIGDGFAPALSSRGRYAVFTATAPADAGFDDNLRVVVNTSTLAAVRSSAPYYQYDQLDSRLLETPQGPLALVYTYQYPADTWSGIYLNRDALQFTTTEEITVEEARNSSSAWGSSDGVIDGDGRVSFVYQDNLRNQLVLARTVGDSQSNQLSKQTLPAATGFGVPRLAYNGLNAELALAWSDAVKLKARRICPAP